MLSLYLKMPDFYIFPRVSIARSDILISAPRNSTEFINLVQNDGDIAHINAKAALKLGHGYEITYT